MADISNSSIAVVKVFLHELKAANFRIEKAFLFGSHARGNHGKWSDIDVALVSPDFSGMPFYDSKKLTPFILKVDTRIELHPFRPEDFTEDNDFIREIIKNGIPLQ
jgi:predicted nucleotidyltransferase